MNPDARPNVGPAAFEAWGTVWHLADAVVIAQSAPRTRFGIWALALYTAARVPAEEGTTRFASLAEYDFP